MMLSSDSLVRMQPHPISAKKDLDETETLPVDKSWQRTRSFQDLDSGQFLVFRMSFAWLGFLWWQETTTMHNKDLSSPKRTLSIPGKVTCLVRFKNCVFESGTNNGMAVLRTSNSRKISATPAASNLPKSFNKVSYKLLFLVRELSLVPGVSKELEDEPRLNAIRASDSASSFSLLLFPIPFGCNPKLRR